MRQKFIGCFVGLAILIMGVVSAKPVMANANDTTVNVVVVGDSISEYMGDCYHSDNYCNYGEDGRGDVVNKGQMWYRMMASFLNENGKYHTNWNYNITCVDALGGSMVYNDNSTGAYHTIYHRGGCCVAASTEVVSGINVDYYGESRLGCLDRGVNNHPKAVDLILIEMGTNDAIAQVSYADEYTAYQEMLQRLHNTYPHAAIVCILPSTTISVFPNATWQEVRNAITSAVYSGVVPVSALIDPSAAFGYCYYESDGATTGIHPNSVGQMYLGNIVANAIKDFHYQTIDIHEPSTEYVTDVAPTCTSSGSKSKHCTICNESIAGTAVSIGVLSHDFQNYQSDGNETCTQDGTKTGTCTRCNATDTIVNTGSKKGHAYKDHMTQEATCDKNGKVTSICEGCGDKKETETPKKEHDYYKTTVKPTKMAQGYTIYKCRNCGDNYKSDYVDKLTVTVPTTQTKPNGTTTQTKPSGTTTTKTESGVPTVNTSGTQSASTVSGTSSKSVWRPALGGTKETKKSDVSGQTSGTTASSVPVTVVTTSEPAKKESVKEKESVNSDTNKQVASKETAKKEVVPVIDVRDEKDLASDRETNGEEVTPNVVLEPNTEQELTQEQTEEIERQQYKKRTILMFVPVILFSLSLVGGATYAIVRIIKKKGEVPGEPEVGEKKLDTESLDSDNPMQL